MRFEFIHSDGGKMVLDNSTGEILSYKEYQDEIKKRKELLISEEKSIQKASGNLPKYITHTLKWGSDKSFMKTFYNYKEEISDELNVYERAFLELVSGYIEWETNRIIINGKDITNKFLEDKLKISNPTLIKTLNSLEEKNIIRRTGVGKGRKTYLTPKYCMKGGAMNNETLTLFSI